MIGELVSIAFMLAFLAAVAHQFHVEDWIRRYRERRRLQYDCEHQDQSLARGNWVHGIYGRYPPFVKSDACERW